MTMQKQGFETHIVTPVVTGLGTLDETKAKFARSSNPTCAV